MKHALLAAVLCLAALPAQATPTAEEAQLPPLSYQQPIFLHPNGCLYAWAEAAGHGRQWYVVDNAARISTNARQGSACTTVLRQPTS